MHEIMKIKAKRRVQRSYRPWERKTLQKIWLKTTKNPQWSLAKSERERGKFEKVDEQVKSEFFLKKTLFTMFD